MAPILAGIGVHLLHIGEEEGPPLRQFAKPSRPPLLRRGGKTTLPRDTPWRRVPYVPTPIIFWLVLRLYALIWSHCSLEPPHALGPRATPRHVSRARCRMPYAVPRTARMGSAAGNLFCELFPCLGGRCRICLHLRAGYSM